MIYAKVETGSDVPAENAQKISRRLAEALSRLAAIPAAEIRVEVIGGRHQRLAEAAKSVHVEIRHCDLSKDKSGELLDAVCPVLGEGLGVDRNSVYVAVISTRNSMWRAR